MSDLDIPQIRSFNCCIFTWKLPPILPPLFSTYFIMSCNSVVYALERRNNLLGRVKMTKCKLSLPFPWPTSCRCGPWTACWSRPCWPHPCWNGMPAVSGWCQCCTDGDMMMMLWKVFQYVDELMPTVFLVLLPSEDRSCCLWSHPQLFCAGCLSFPASLSFKLNRRGHQYIYFGRCQTFWKIFWSFYRPWIPRRLSCSFRRSIQRLYRNCPVHL